MSKRVTHDAVLALRADPLALGELGGAARRECFGLDILLRETPPAPAHERAAVLRRGEWIACTDWPAPDAWQAGDRACLRVEMDDAARWLDYLDELAARTRARAEAAALAVAPFATVEAGIHRLWTIAAARLLLPAAIRVEAHHDLLGTHLAQVALTFGADTLAGPHTEARSLPLAGVTRPNETSVEALETLVRTAGLHPHRHEEGTPEPLDGDLTRGLVDPDEL